MKVICEEKNQHHLRWSTYGLGFKKLENRGEENKKAQKGMGEKMQATVSNEQRGAFIVHLVSIAVYKNYMSSYWKAALYKALCNFVYIRTFTIPYTFED